MTRCAVLAYTVLALAMLVIGCSWEPPHDNPIDPDAPGYRAEGSLSVLVRTLNNLLIPEAEVRIPALGWFALTRPDGRVDFEHIPEGQWVVEAFRDSESNISYDRKTITVNIYSGASLDTVMRLNALPRIESTSAIAITVPLTPNYTGPKSFNLLLKSVVNDPDGQANLKSVIWTMEGVPDSLDRNLQYRPDSSYWWMEISGDSLNYFPSGKLDIDVQGKPIFFEAFDNDSSVTRSNATYLLRVPHELPGLESVNVIGDSIKLDWRFASWEFDRNPLLYYFLVRIFPADDASLTVYRAYVPATNENRADTTFKHNLEPDAYKWEVYVIDKFGNRAKSPTGNFEISADTTRFGIGNVRTQHR